MTSLSYKILIVTVDFNKSEPALPQNVIIHITAMKTFQVPDNSLRTRVIFFSNIQNFIHYFNRYFIRVGERNRLLFLSHSLPSLLSLSFHFSTIVQLIICRYKWKRRDSFGKRHIFLYHMHINPCQINFVKHININLNDI